MADVFQQDYELIPAGPHDNIPAVKHHLQQVSQLNQRRIPKKMPVLIIDVFKIIDVNNHHPAGIIGILTAEIIIDQLFTEKLIV